MILRDPIVSDEELSEEILPERPCFRYCIQVETARGNVHRFHFVGHKQQRKCQTSEGSIILKNHFAAEAIANAVLRHPDEYGACGYVAIWLCSIDPKGRIVERQQFEVPLLLL